MVKIVPGGRRQAPPEPDARPAGKARTGGDQIQTQVFTLKYESAAQLVPILRPLIAPDEHDHRPIRASNTLVITDYADNLQRIARIIDSIDQPGGTEPVRDPARARLGARRRADGEPRCSRRRRRRRRRRRTPRSA